MPLELGDDLLAQRSEVERRGHDRDLVAEPCTSQIEQILDHPAHSLRTVKYAHCGPSALIVQRLGIHEQRRAHNDRGERISQIVTEDAERLVPKVCGGLDERLDGFRERLVDRLVESGYSSRVGACALPQT